VLSHDVSVPPTTRLLLDELFGISQELAHFVACADGNGLEGTPPSAEEVWWLGVRMSEFGTVLQTLGTQPQEPCRNATGGPAAQ
jgi:hypothetical protein